MIGFVLGLALVGLVMWWTYADLARVEPPSFEPLGVVRGVDNGSRCERETPYRGERP